MLIVFVPQPHVYMTIVTIVQWVKTAGILDALPLLMNDYWMEIHTCPSFTNVVLFCFCFFYSVSTILTPTGILQFNSDINHPANSEKYLGLLLKKRVLALSQEWIQGRTELSHKNKAKQAVDLFFKNNNNKRKK